jgi:hypothetical protein
MADYGSARAVDTAVAANTQIDHIVGPLEFSAARGISSLHRQLASPKTRPAAG